LYVTNASARPLIAAPKTISSPGSSNWDSVEKAGSDASYMV